jgi:hypothetical protein
VLRRSVESAQYTSIEFGRRCRMQAYAARWARSATRMNNAMCESFFATLECELLDRCRFKTQTEAHRAALEFIEGFYNPPALLDRISLTDRLRASASRCGSHPRRTPARHRARGRQGQAPPGAPTAAVLDRPCARRPHHRAGRDGRMALPGAEPRNRRATCRQIRWPDPRRSTLHETGVSPYNSARADIRRH